jgi:tetratricopeptide (TPR) repeat protein
MNSNRSADKVKKLFIEASMKLQQGDAAGARRGLEKVVKLAPGTAAAWYNMGLASQQLEMHSKALKEYQRSLAIDPTQIEAIVNLGLSHKSLGEVEAAEKAAHRALSMDQEHPRALNLLGSIKAEQREYDSAQKYFERALNSDQSFIDARQNLANSLLETGSPDEAEKILAPLLEQAPPGKEPLELHGQILLDQRRFDQLPPLLKNLKARFPDDQGVLILEISFCELINDNFTVIEIAQKFLKQFPDHARVWSSLGNAYFQLDSIENAKASYLKAIEFDPEHAEYRNNLGLAFSSLGEKEQAERNYRKSLELNPEYIEAYRNLVAMKKFTSLEDPDAVQIEKLWQQSDVNEPLRCKLAFALGKVYDDCGMHDQAFETYDIGNKLKSKENTMDFNQYFSHIDRIIEVFDSPPAITVDDSASAFQPIFILGMSRSGTTLVEQIISRHPDVTGCGELACIEQAIGNLEKNHGEMRVYPDGFLDLDLLAFTKENQGYFEWVARLHDISTTYFTDKMPFNFVHVWLIRALFPNSAIVHCHRHPLDVIVSNYFQLYGSDVNFVYDLEVLAGYYVRYHRLMRHWHRIFAEDIYKVQYEALVADSENQTRMLIEGARLQWDDACLDPNKSDTAVRTASIWQVRQGIYTSSRERWRRYQNHLGPAIDILAKEGILDEELRYVD